MENKLEKIMVVWKDTPEKNKELDDFFNKEL